MKIIRRFTMVGQHPHDTIEWTRRSSKITNPDGSVVFEMNDAEVPAGWSQLATDIMVSKYFRKAGVPSKTERVMDGDGTPSWLCPSVPTADATFGPETSAKDVIHRLVGTWTYWGYKHGYFSSHDDAEAFYDELFYMVAHQMVAPNSPQWFNTGLNWAYGINGPAQGHWYTDPATGETKLAEDAYTHPQPHACFLQSIEDDLVNDGGIMDLWVREARLFKYGSGTGTNFSRIRGKDESLSGGGRSSGLMSFLKIGDAAAGSIKSGGTTRRAAKMACLDLDHPDIEGFINWKVREEIKVAAMVEGLKHIANQKTSPTDTETVGETAARLGLKLDYDFNGESYQTVSGQNSNNSVRIPHEFFNRVDAGEDWELRGRKCGKVTKTLPARDLWEQIAYAAWRCADPGVQFDDTINEWHTCPESGRINTSNPCCFTGDTLVQTSEGNISFNDLMVMASEGRRLPYAIGWDWSNNMPALRPIKHVWKAGRANQLVEVTTDKGLKLKCTPDHVFYLRDGSEVRAGDLHPGMRLRKMGIADNVARSGRRMIRHRTTDSVPNGEQYLSRFMWSEVHGDIPDGHEVHHKNGDCCDDRLSNYELVNADDHRVHHSAGESNPRFIECPDETLIEVWEALEATPKRTHHNGQQVTSCRWNTYVRKNNLVGIVPIAASTSRDGRIRGMTWDDFSQWIDERRGCVNDVVLTVTAMSADEDVYDLEVEDIHNFAVTSPGNLHGIVVSNSEYMFLDDTACNLASLNLLKFYDATKRSFDIEGFEHGIDLWTMVLEISVLMASFPSKEIARLSYEFRTLGLGYANIGAMLMQAGIPYDSDQARAICGAITSVLTGRSYAMSAKMAAELGPFPGYHKNREHMLRVVRNHRRAAYGVSRDDKYAEHLPVGDYESLVIKPVHIDADLLRKASTGTYGQLSNAADLLHHARTTWDEALREGEEHGYRNAQTTCIAPTGTIGLLMDCDTTGVEPDFALVKFKKLAGGGYFKIVNQSVAPALRGLGYGDDQVATIMAYIETHSTVEGSPHMKPEHYAVFDCANKCGEIGKRFIHANGHIRMMAAAQPFLSGAISKTINLPNEATLEDIKAAYRLSWELGLKSNALYRDGCKLSQPLNTSMDDEDDDTDNVEAGRDEVAGEVAVAAATADPQIVERVVEKIVERPMRRRLPDTRDSKTHKFSVANHEGYITVGMYDDGTPGEVFITMSKEGSTVGGLMDSLATAISIALQYGVPIGGLIDKFTHQRFEPAGMTLNRDIPFAKSLVDYVFRWIGMEFVPGYREINAPKRDKPDMPVRQDTSHVGGGARVGTIRPSGAAIDPPVAEDTSLARSMRSMQADAPACDVCGTITVRSGQCYKCLNCGNSMGCS